MRDLTDEIFHDETNAREFFERTRWPGGVVCPFCGSKTEDDQPAG